MQRHEQCLLRAGGRECVRAFMRVGVQAKPGKSHDAILRHFKQPAGKHDAITDKLHLT